MVGINYLENNMIINANNEIINDVIITPKLICNKCGNNVFIYIGGGIILLKNYIVIKCNKCDTKIIIGE